MPLYSTHKEKTAFVTHCGFYQYRAMPFGLTNAPATFQRAIEQILGEYPVFIDDVIVCSKTPQQHLDDIRIFFDFVQRNNLKLGLKKCVFFRKRIEYLGHAVSAEGIHVNPMKVAAAQQYPIPVCVKDVKAFFGFTGYYRRLIRDYSKIPHPLTQLLKKDVPFVWTPECQSAFVTLKERRVTAPVLIYPDFEKQFILSTDASLQGLGAVLEQYGTDPKRPQPLQYASVSLSKARSNYSITELECLAVVWAITRFRHYLSTPSFQINY